MGTKLQIMNAECQMWTVQMDPNVTIAELKQKAFEKFYNSANIDINWDAFRVVHPSEFRTLSDTHTIHDEKLKDHDILLLVRRRSLVEEPLTMDVELKGPTQADIDEATRDLPLSDSLPGPSGGAQPQAGATFQSWSEGDFQLELRKILISLISVMSTLLKGNPDAETVCREMHAKVQNRLAHCSNRPIPGTSFTYPPPPEIDMTPLGIVAGILELKKREFRPNQSALESLRAMGYQDAEIVDALRVGKNSKMHASHWLLSDDREIAEDRVRGLDPESRLLNSIVTNPIIRLGINNPKTLQAFLGIIESSGSATLWLSDPDTAPVLSAIFKLYHADKHVLN